MDPGDLHRGAERLLPQVDEHEVARRGRRAEVALAAQIKIKRADQARVDRDGPAPLVLDARAVGVGPGHDVQVRPGEVAAELGGGLGEVQIRQSQSEGLAVTQAAEVHDAEQEAVPPVLAA